MGNKTRNPYYDNLKYILITLVVVGHFIENMPNDAAPLQALYQWIYYFHMPAFLFVGGLLAKSLYTPQRGLRVNTISYYFILYFVFYTVLWTYLQLFKQSDWTPFYPSGIPWYILTMGILGLGIPLVSRVRGGAKVVLPIMAVVAILMGFDSHMGDFLAIGRVVSYAPFYYAGYFLSLEKLEGFVTGCRKRKYPIVLAIFLLVAVYIFVFLAQTNDWNAAMKAIRLMATGHNSYSVTKADPMVCAAAKAFHYVLASAMILALCLIAPRKKTFISDPGSRTLQVYLIHPFAYCAFKYLGAATILDPWQPYSGYVVVAGAIVLTYILARPKFLAIPLAKLRSVIKLDKIKTQR